jgi:hypothetical protein
VAAALEYHATWEMLNAAMSRLMLRRLTRVLPFSHSF